MAILHNFRHTTLHSLEHHDFEEIPVRGKLLVDAFSMHAQKEEIGLFRELQMDGSGTPEVERLTSEHRHILGGLTDLEGGSDPEVLRSLMVDLLNHTEVEETDLFPFAWQVLPPESWIRIVGAVSNLHSG